MLKDIAAKPTVQLVEEAQRGSKTAFGDLYLTHVLLVRTVLARWLSLSNDVEDLTHDVFLQAFLKISTLRNSNAFKGWLLTIAHNRAINYCRRQKTQINPADINQLVVDGRPEHPDVSDTYDQVNHAMRQLKSSDANSLVDFYWRHLSINDIAAKENVPSGTVKRRLHIARQRIAAHLQ